MAQPEEAQGHDQHHHHHDGPQGHLPFHREAGGQQGHDTRPQVLHAPQDGPGGARLTREGLDGAGGGGRVEDAAADEVNRRAPHQGGCTHQPEQARHQYDEGPQPQEGNAKAHQLALTQAEAQLGGEPGAEQVARQRQHEQHAHCAGAQFEPSFRSQFQN